MRIPSLAFTIETVLVVLICTCFSQAQTKIPPGTKEVMKIKLEYSQRLLSAIATEDFELISSNSENLSKLSQVSGWRARETKQYEMFSDEFRRNVDSITKAAKDRNIEAAALGYVQMTMSCVNCHRYMRGPKSASLH